MRTSGPSLRAAAVSTSTASRLGQLRANRTTPPSPACSASATRSSGMRVPSKPTARACPGPVVTRDHLDMSASCLRRSCLRTGPVSSLPGRHGPSPQLPRLRLRLLQPEPHVHLAVHRRRGGEVPLRLLALARSTVERAEAEMAVGGERAHAAGVGECQRLAVVGRREPTETHTQRRTNARLYWGLHNGDSSSLPSPPRILLIRRYGLTARTPARRSTRAAAGSGRADRRSRRKGTCVPGGPGADSDRGPTGCRPSSRTWS